MAERIHINWRKIGYEPHDDRGRYTLHLPLHSGFTERVLDRSAHELAALMREINLPSAYISVEIGERTMDGHAHSGNIRIDAPPSIFEVDGTNLHNLIEGAVEQAYLWVCEREQEEATSIIGWLRELSGTQPSTD
jgi:hypothetical protein